jgi:hypothetical protein
VTLRDAGYFEKQLRARARQGAPSAHIKLMHVRNTGE